jgi:hypothetical protein
LSGAPHPSEEDVLDDFLSETSRDPKTLARYLQLYPMHAGALLDLHYALERQALDPAEEREGPDDAWISQSVAALRTRLNTSTATDPFQNLGRAGFNAVKAKLGVRSSTLTGFRDRLVTAASVPTHVLHALAEALGAGFDELVSFLELPARQAAAQSFRADGRPQPPRNKVTFAELLEATNEPPETRARLLGEGD